MYPFTGIDHQRQSELARVQHEAAMAAARATRDQNLAQANQGQFHFQQSLNNLRDYQNFGITPRNDMGGGFGGPAGGQGGAGAMAPRTIRLSA